MQASISDPGAPFYDRWALARLNDPRDLPFFHLMLQCALVAVFGVGLFFAGSLFYYLAPIYLAVWGGWVLDRYILMLHCTSHRQLFKPRYGRYNRIIPWMLGAFFGETPESYFVHHMGMHHVEGNLQADISSTMRYRRDSFRDWLRYYARFLFVGLLELGAYHRDRGNRKLVRRLLVGEGSYWLLVALLMWVNWEATLVVFVLPLLLVRTLMMVGNWGQHAFVCAGDPGNPHRNSITCINTRYNRRCFNDGYHIHHHLKPRCHWTELDREFEANREEYGRQDALVFDGIDFFGVWLLLMTGKWDRLAEAVVHLPGAPERTREEVISVLKARVQPIAS
ncbi:MAG: fatty acid desaturase [Myxococcales bacterium]|nr:fatty acid desaturase [Myxococcales bacterium]